MFRAGANSRDIGDFPFRSVLRARPFLRTQQVLAERFYVEMAGFLHNEIEQASSLSSELTCPLEQQLERIAIVNVRLRETIAGTNSCGVGSNDDGGEILIGQGRKCSVLDARVLEMREMHRKRRFLPQTFSNADERVP